MLAISFVKVVILLKIGDAHRPSPPTRTSASRTTDWKVKYSPQGSRDDISYRAVARSQPQVGENYHNSVWH